MGPNPPSLGQGQKEEEVPKQLNRKKCISVFIKTRLSEIPKTFTNG